MIRFTADFPQNASVRDASGLPWGCVTQPLAYHESLKEGPIAAANQVARYINPYAVFEKNSWRCPLCMHKNIISSNSRYSNPENLKELTNAVVEYDVMESSDKSKREGGSILSSLPAYVAVVDVTGGPKYIEMVKSGLLAAIEVLPRSTMFGLVVFSESIGVFDLRAPLPHVKYLSIPPSFSSSSSSSPSSPSLSSSSEGGGGGGGSSFSSLSLDDIIPLSSALVQISIYETNILAAIDTLQNLVPHILSSSPSPSPSFPSPLSSSSFSLSSSHSLSLFQKRRGTGPTVQALVDYLSVEDDPLNIRVGLFLAGAPSYGEGTLPPPPPSEDGFKADYLSPKTAFYRDQAERALEGGICMDMYLVSDSHVALSSMKFLSTLTGGHISWYRNAEEASLPQDIYRHLSRPQGYHGMLRVRTSPGFKTKSCFGHLLPSASDDNLFHVEGCDTDKTVAFDFDFASGAELGSWTPTIQIAFAYTYLPPSDRLASSTDSTSSPSPSPSLSHSHHSPHTSRSPLISSSSSSLSLSSSSSSSHITTVKRRLRIHTVQVPVARSAHELFKSADADSCMCLLTHKIIRTCLDEGIREGRSILQDWLTILLSKNNELQRASDRNVPLALDLTFSGYQSMRPIPRLVFGLLKSPLLRCTQDLSTVNISADEWIYHQYLYGSIDPTLLHRAIYPALSSYGGPNNLASQLLPLSRASITTSGSRAHDVPFPPPKDSSIRNTLNALKTERHIMPEVIMARAGMPGEENFYHLLIEENNAYGPSLIQFMEVINQEVMKCLSQAG